MTGYSGTHNGMHYNSLYPNLYRVRFVQVIAGRRYDVDKIVTATSEYHARGRCGGDIRGGIAVDHVGTMTREDRKRPLCGLCGGRGWRPDDPLKAPEFQTLRPCERCNPKGGAR